MEESVEIYRAIPILWDNTPTSVTTAHVNDSVPTENDVEWAVQRLQGHRSGDPSWMRAKHLQEWMQEQRVADAEAEERGT